MAFKPPSGRSSPPSLKTSPTTRTPGSHLTRRRRGMPCVLSARVERPPARTPRGSSSRRRQSQKKKGILFLRLSLGGYPHDQSCPGSSRTPGNAKAKQHNRQDCQRLCCFLFEQQAISFCTWDQGTQTFGAASLQRVQRAAPTGMRRCHHAKPEGRKCEILKLERLALGTYI